MDKFYSFDGLNSMEKIVMTVFWNYIKATGVIVSNQNIDLVMENAIKSHFGKLVPIVEE